MIHLKPIGSILRETFREWRKDNVFQMAAALAFYSLFSLTPVVMIVSAMASFVFGPRTTQSEIIERIRIMAGEQTASAIRVLIGTFQGAATDSPAIVGAMALLVGATAVFADLHGSLNAIWKAPPRVGHGVTGELKRRFLSFLLVMGIGLFLIASFGVSAALAALTRVLGERPALPGFLWPFVNGAISFLAFTVLFAMIYKLLPDVRVTWDDVWIGATVTSFLFTIGQWLIGFYVGKELVGPRTGRAGSLVAFLIWIYFSAHIFFLGAEFTHVYAKKYRSRP